MGHSTLKVSEIVQLHVRGEDLYILLNIEGGDQVSLLVPKGVDREMVHIMVDALHFRQSSGFEPAAGRLLVPGELQPARPEKKIEKLQLQEKFVLEAKSAGATTMTFRLAPSSIRKWIEDAEIQLAQRKPPKLQS